MFSSGRTAMHFLVLLFFAGAAPALTKSSDFDGNGKVNFDDFFLFADAFGGGEALYDLDESGTVDIEDFFVFAADFGKTLSPAADSGGLQWTQITPTSARPAERFDHTVFLDPARNRLVLFGGRRIDSLSDTWIYDLESRAWREVRAAAAPSPRHGYSAIYDAARRRILVFGGQRIGGSFGFFNDVWAFDLVRETWEEVPTSAEKPSPRYGSSAIYDVPRNRMIVSHGFTIAGRFDDTWALNLATGLWADITPETGPKPLKRCLHRSVYDDTGDRMLLFGGCSSGVGPCPQGDFWSFNLKTNTWTELKPLGQAPGARSDPALVFDSAGMRAILFGGLEASAVTDDVWQFDAVAQVWTRLAVRGPAPSARRSHSATFDPGTGRLLMFGGTGTAGDSNDLWELTF